MPSYTLNSDMAFLQDAMISCVQRADILCHTQLRKFYKWSQVSFWSLSSIHPEQHLTCMWASIELVETCSAQDFLFLVRPFFTDINSWDQLMCTSLNSECILHFYKFIGFFNLAMIHHLLKLEFLLWRVKDGSIISPATSLWTDKHLGQRIVPTTKNLDGLLYLQRCFCNTKVWRWSVVY